MQRLAEDLQHRRVDSAIGAWHSKDALDGVARDEQEAVALTDLFQSLWPSVGGKSGVVDEVAVMMISAALILLSHSDSPFRSPSAPDAES